MRHLAQAFGPGDPILLFRQLAIQRRCSASRANIARAAAAAVGAGLGAGQDLGLGACSVRIGLLCSLAALLCLPAWFAALRLLSVVSALLGFFSCYNWHPFWFVFVPAEGNRFALGTGGIRWSLLVGGLGPVLSIPKLCFKPFRRLSAVGFVLGWHREPLFNNPAGAVGYCIYDGRNH